MRTHGKELFLIIDGNDIEIRMVSMDCHVSIQDERMLMEIFTIQHKYRSSPDEFGQLVNVCIIEEDIKYY